MAFLLPLYITWLQYGKGCHGHICNTYYQGLMFYLYSGYKNLGCDDFRVFMTDILVKIGWTHS